MADVPHDHTCFVEGCFRCELGREEAEEIRKQAEKEIHEAMISVMRRLLTDGRAMLTHPYGERQGHHLVFDGSLELTENEFDLLTEFTDFLSDA